MSEYIAHQRKSDKEIQTVAEHLNNTAILTKEYADKIKLTLTGELIGLLHDLGKYSEEFQEYIKYCISDKLNFDNSDSEENLSWKKGKIDHSTAGAQLVFSEKKGHPAIPYLSQIIAICIASHHGGLIDCLTPEGSDNYTLRMTKDYKKTHFSEVKKKCNLEIIERVKTLMYSEDVISEMDTVLHSVKGNPFSVGMITRFLYSCLLDADRTDTADFENLDNKQKRLNAKYPKWEDFIKALEKRLDEFSVENRVDEIRTEVSKSCKDAGKRERGIFTLTVPTGGGKTLASLRFALEHATIHDLERIIYVIPFTSIIDQNAREVENIFHSLSEEYGFELILEHHSNITPEKETTEHQLMAENWDAPIVYTTSVQLLDTLFNGGTRSARRMHNLSKSIIVFDEIQTLPVKMVHLFNNAMNFLIKVCGSSILLCTATQPLLQYVDEKKGSLDINPVNEIMPDIGGLFKELRRVEIIDKRQAGGLSDEDIALLVKNELAQTGSVLTIVNTKRSAERLYHLCKEYASEVFYLSTNQCPQHRLEIIDRIRNLAIPDSQTPVICISTQLIEAGVDVDFGSVIRFVAGLDSIAQAAGRCNRSGKQKNIGRVLIVNPRIEKLGSLEDIQIGKTISERVIREYEENQELFQNSLLSPEAISLYFKYYFFERSELMDYPVTHSIDDTLLGMLSGNTNIKQIYQRINKKNPDIPLIQSFSTAGQLFKVIDSPTQGVIIPFREGEEIINELCASENILKKKNLLKKAQRYTVNIYENNLKRLHSEGAIETINDSGLFCLRKEYYSEEFGVSFEALYKDYDSSAYCL